MTPAEAVLLSWQFPAFPTLGGMLGLWAYWLGWRKLTLRHRGRFPLWRAWCFTAGVVAAWVAVASPLDALTNLLLQAHMVQHLLLTMVAPPLILLGSPMLPLLCGVPKRFAREGIAPFLVWSPAKKFGAFLTHPVVAWLLFQASVILWHLPPFYEMALRSRFWHEVEHAIFFTTATLFWWFVVRPWPNHEKLSRGWIIPYLLVADLCNTGLAAFLSFYDQVLYPTYAAAPRLWGLTALEDQAGAGAIMWVPGSAAYLVPVGIIISSLLQGRKGVRPSEYFGTAKPVAPVPIPGKRRSFPWGAFGTGLRWFFLVVAAVVVLDGILGPSLSPLNLAGVLPWTYWRGFGVIVLLLLGNLFCMGCPMVLVRDLWRRWFPPEYEWPRWLRNKWPALALLVLFFWSYEAFSWWDRPFATAVLVLGYFAAAISIDGFFKGASFCKYVCPIGQYHFVMAFVSPRTVRVKAPEACLTCTTHDCIKGNETQRGCELKLFVPRKSGNMDCTLCLDCVRACPKQNIELGLALPSDDWTNSGARSGVGRYEKRVDLALLIGVLVFGAFLNAAGMIAPVLAWQDATVSLEMRPWFLAAAAVLGLLVLPAAVGWSMGSVSRALGNLRDTPVQVASRFAPALAPLGAGLWAAHFLFHLLTGIFTAIPAAQRALGLKPSTGLQGLSGAWIQNIELLLLDAGLLLAWYGIWRIAGKIAPERPLRTALPWFCFALLLWAVAIWILFQPMQMRGTLDAVAH